MNWKTLYLIAGLTLTASLAACSNTPPASTNQAIPSSFPAATVSGDAINVLTASVPYRTSPAGISSMHSKDSK